MHKKKQKTSTEVHKIQTQHITLERGLPGASLDALLATTDKTCVRSIAGRFVKCWVLLGFAYVCSGLLGFGLVKTGFFAPLTLDS